jgi:hypothetical protein
MTESIDQADSGYPEEQPEEVVPDDDPSSGGESAARQKSRSGDAERAPDNDDGTATGNPRSAGA